VRLSPLGTSATGWPIVPAPDDRWWVCSRRWNEKWQGKPKYSEKTCPSATLSITNPTWPDLSSNPGFRGGKPATNRLSYGTASLDTLPLEYSGQGVNITTHPHLVPRLCMHGALPPLPCTYSRRGDSLSIGENFKLGSYFLTRKLFYIQMKITYRWLHRSVS
jgi:hypothetical protein